MNRIRTLRDARFRVEAVQAAQDHEQAHALEDALFRDMLKSIADGDALDPPALLASVALRTLEIDFPRWCA